MMRLYLHLPLASPAGLGMPSPGRTRRTIWIATCVPVPDMFQVAAGLVDSALWKAKGFQFICECMLGTGFNRIAILISFSRWALEVTSYLVTCPGQPPPHCVQGAHVNLSNGNGKHLKSERRTDGIASERMFVATCGIPHRSIHKTIPFDSIFIIIFIVLRFRIFFFAYNRTLWLLSRCPVVCANSDLYDEWQWAMFLSSMLSFWVLTFSISGFLHISDRDFYFYKLFRGFLESFCFEFRKIKLHRSGFQLIFKFKKTRKKYIF